jgi:hypothetical protein
MDKQMNFELAHVEKLIAHRVGNKIRDEGIKLSFTESSVNSDLSSVLLSSYLKSIALEKNECQFYHEDDLNLNEARHYVNQYFTGNIDFLEFSYKIANHLYEKSLHPNIKTGDLLVILFSNIKLDDKYLRAIGLFKSEIIDNYITVKENDSSLNVDLNTGINPSLIDKGALIFEKYFNIFAVDRLRSRTKFWTDDFLKIKKSADPTTSGKVISYISTKIAESIDNPIERRRYGEHLLELCESGSALDLSLLKDQSEPFISDQNFSTILSTTQRKFGLASIEEISTSSNIVSKSLERAVSQIDAGFGVKLMIPGKMKCTDIKCNKEETGDITFIIRVTQ